MKTMIMTKIKRNNEQRTENKKQFYPVKENQKCRSIQQQMSRHNSRAGFEISQELRLDNQQLELKIRIKSPLKQT